MKTVSALSVFKMRARTCELGVCASRQAERDEQPTRCDVEEWCVPCASVPHVVPSSSDFWRVGRTVTGFTPSALVASVTLDEGQRT
jgi:hypothetical protein